MMLLEVSHIKIVRPKSVNFPTHHKNIYFSENPILENRKIQLHNIFIVTVSKFYDIVFFFGGNQ